MYSRRPCRRSVNRSQKSVAAPSGRSSSAWRRCSAPTTFAVAARSSSATSRRVASPSTSCCSHPPDYLQTAKVFDLLLAVPKYGRVKVNKVLSQCRISPSKTLGGLSERQRGELVTLLRRRYAAALRGPPRARVPRVRHHRPVGRRQGHAHPRAARAHPRLELSVSATTRGPRPGERDGVDYHFLRPRSSSAGCGRRFVEHADLLGRRYGTLAPSSSAAPGGLPVVLEIEVQGARQVREAMPDALQVFIAPPVARRAARAARRSRDRRARADRAAAEDRRARARRAPEFAHLVVIDRLEQATDELVAVVRGELARVSAGGRGPSLPSCAVHRADTRLRQKG